MTKTEVIYHSDLAPFGWCVEWDGHILAIAKTEEFAKDWQRDASKISNAIDRIKQKAS